MQARAPTNARDSSFGEVVGKHRGRQLRAILITAMDRESEVRSKWKALGGNLNERDRRLWAAAEAKSLGSGAVALVARACGLARDTVYRGMRDLERPSDLPADRMRMAGGGRKKVRDQKAEIIPALDRLVDPTVRGDPMCPLRWTIKSTRELADELGRQGFAVSHVTVGKILHEMEFSLQGNRKTREGTDHPDRNAQFERINSLVREHQVRGDPAISVDAKKKENVGNFANRGREWHPLGKPEQVRMHDFPDEQLGKALPYGVYDLARNEGLVNVGITHDTAEFAVATLRLWWRECGQQLYPKATALLVTADGGGSNGSRTRLWKFELQRFADEVGLSIRVAHFPPGTSKWNKIEHRMFCHITRNWRGRPLTSLEIIVALIGATTTKKGLRIKAALDTRVYEKGRAISDKQLAELNLVRDEFHGDWNYVLQPRRQI